MSSSTVSSSCRIPSPLHTICNFQQEQIIYRRCPHQRLHLKEINLCFMSDSEELIIDISAIIEVPAKELVQIIDYVIDCDPHPKEVSPSHVESFPCLVTGNSMLLLLYFNMTFHSLLSFCLKHPPWYFSPSQEQNCDEQDTPDIFLKPSADAVIFIYMCLAVSHPNSSEIFMTDNI